MQYVELAKAYEKISKETSKLKKTGIAAELLKKSGQELSSIALLLQGRVFPSYDEREVGIASQSAARIIAMASGFPTEEVGKRFRKTGDYGLVAEELMGKKKQQTLLSRSLPVEKVFDNLRRVAMMEGKGSQDRKFGLVAELVSSAKPLEAKYIIRTSIGDMRVGVARGILRDAIAEAFLETDEMEKKKESQKAVEWAWFLKPDYGEVAEIAREEGLDGLRKARVQVGKPYHVQLAEKSPGLKEALKEFERPALEYKYDGARIIIHKNGDKAKIFTRSFEDITRQFPELQELVSKAVKPGKCILEGEMLGFNKETGKPMPFQSLSQRIKRKYDIDRMVKEIPVQVSLFDITYVDGKDLFGRRLSERWALLKESIKPVQGKFQLAKHIETKDLARAEAFYRESLEASQEGLMVKNLDSTYYPGRRVVGGWLKVKPVMENLDLVIIGATWGTGKRAGWLGSFELGCRQGDEFKTCGMIGTGVKEKKDEDGHGVTFDELTTYLKPKIVSEKGNNVIIKPDLVVEVAYEEIQQSPNYDSGFALRFPRVLRIRPDKPASEADTKSRIERLYAQQKGKIRG